jgi:hypothetical protein
MLGLVLFLAPFLPSTRYLNDQELYFYLYAVWGLVILLIIFIAVCLPKSTGGTERKTDH